MEYKTVNGPDQEISEERSVKCAVYRSVLPSLGVHGLDCEQFVVYCTSSVCHVQNKSYTEPCSLYTSH